MGFQRVQFLMFVLRWMTPVSTFPHLSFPRNPATGQCSLFYINGLAPRYNPSNYLPGDIWNSPQEPKWPPTQCFTWKQRHPPFNLASLHSRDYKVIEPLSESEGREQFDSEERAIEKEVNNCRSSVIEIEKQFEPLETKPPLPSQPAATPLPFIYTTNPFIRSRSTYTADYTDLEGFQLNYPESLVNVPNRRNNDRKPKAYIMIPEKDLVKLEATLKLPAGYSPAEHAAENQPIQAIMTPASPPTEEPERNKTLKSVTTRSIDLASQLCPLKTGDPDFVNGQFVKVRRSKLRERTNLTPKGRYKMAIIGDVPVRVKNQGISENLNVTLPFDVYSVQSIPYEIYRRPVGHARSSDLSLVPRFLLSIKQNEFPVSEPDAWLSINYDQLNKEGTLSTFETNIKNTEALKSQAHNEGSVFSSGRMNQNSELGTQHIFNYPRFPPNFGEELLHPTSKESLMYSKSWKSDVSPLSGGPEKTIYCRQPENTHESSIEWNCDKSEMKRHPLPSWVSIGTVGGSSHYPSNGITSPDEMNALNRNKFPYSVPLDTLQKPIVDHDSSQNSAASIALCNPYF